MRRRGITIVELMVLILIIAILVALMVPAINRSDRHSPRLHASGI